MASQIAYKRRLNNEERLYRELSKFFKKLKKEVLSSLEEYWSDYQMLQGHINLICAPVHEAHREYYEIIKKYKLKEYQLGKEEATRLCNRAGVRYAFKETITMPINGFIKKNSDTLFGTLPKAEQDLLNRTFKSSEKTLSRVDDQLNKIITDGYRGGKGINDIANQVTKRFDQLSSWEAKRIARTEVNTSHNKATVDTYQDFGVEYTQWIAAADDRTRDSHVEVDGEIIPLGGHYSNGLAYPGDMSGPIEEWINCRCSNAPFVIPYGYMAPSFSPFRESDLIPIIQETLKEPTQEQLNTNLTDEQRVQYNKIKAEMKQAEDIIKSPFYTEREKSQAQTAYQYNAFKLNQLKMIAHGELAKGVQSLVKNIIGNAQTQQPVSNESEIKTITDTSDLLSIPSGAEMRELGKLLTPQRRKSYSLSMRELKQQINEYNNAHPSQRAGIEKKIRKTKEYMKDLEVKSRTAKTIDVSNIQLESYKADTQSSSIKDIGPMEAKQIEAQRKIEFNEKDIQGMDYHLGPNYTDLTGYIFKSKSFQEVLDRIPSEEGRKMFVDNIKEKLKQIEDIMEKTPGTLENTVYYRGGKLDENMEIGEIGKFDAPTSTSYRESTAKNFVEEGEYLMEVYAPKGTKGVVVNDGRFHKHSSSHEYTLKPGQEYVILEIDRVNKKAKILLL